MSGLLETKSLTIGYSQSAGTKILQQDLSLSIAKGETISLMGQNGVGKSTFIKTISGLIPALGGEVFIQNQKISALSKNEMARSMSVVLTEKPYAQNLTVLELIAIGRHPYSGWMGTLNQKDLEVIEWAINETHINYLANHKIFELSDGQLQKVMIARALAQETDLIILDEPAAHLDLYNKIEVMMLLRKIADQGKGVLISTHDLQVSTQLSDKLWLFNFNEEVKIGTPEDLILDGSLEKTLYLEGYGYDMMYGTVENSRKPKGNISVAGPDKEKFWTIQALKRNGFLVKNKADVQIDIRNEKWYILQKSGENVCNSISELLDLLKISYQNLK